MYVCRHQSLPCLKHKVYSSCSETFCCYLYLLKLLNCFHEKFANIRESFVKVEEDWLEEKKKKVKIFLIFLLPPPPLFFLFYQYPAALMNLGAILHLNGKLKAAEENYLLALQLKPDDVITQSNLRKLWNIMEKQGLKTSKTWWWKLWTFSLSWLKPRTRTSTQLSNQRTHWTWLQGSEVSIAARSYSAFLA